MKKLFVFIFVSFGLSVNGLFFDPHNHVNGVLDAFAYVNLSKTWRGQELTTEELESFWNKLQALVLNPKFQNDSRVSTGTRAALLCNQPGEYLNRDENYRKILKRNIGKVLSATPTTSFDSAYAMRGYVEDEILFKGKSSEDIAQIRDDLVRATIYKLALDEVGLVELSTNFIGGDKTGKRLKAMNRYQEIIDDMVSSSPEPKNKEVYDAIKGKFLEIPHIYWLLMGHTAELGRVGNSYYDYQTGECVLYPFPSYFETNPQDHVYQALVNNPYTVGIDIASTETTCFSPQGMTKLQSFTKAVYDAAKERAARNHPASPKKLLVHIHVGEGSPIFDSSTVENLERKACILHQKRRDVREDKVKRQIHSVEANRNVGMVLKAIETVKEKIKDIDNYVVFRLGHVTHISNAQAKLARELNIEADVNLSSNIATGSWIPDSIKKYLGADETPNQLLSELLKKGAEVEEIFGNHGIKWLLFYDVTTILGSDGAGVEHANQGIDYKLADEVLNYWRISDPEFSKKNITIEKLIDNQTRHVQEMGYPELMSR